MFRSPAHRGPTMIALRARRESYRLASEILNPHVDHVECTCPLCLADLVILEPDAAREIECAHCHGAFRYPDECARPADRVQKALRRTFDPHDESRSAVSCMKCLTVNVFDVTDEPFGIVCGMCGQLLIPPAPAMRPKLPADARLRVKVLFWVLAAVLLFYAILFVIPLLG